MTATLPPRPAVEPDRVSVPLVVVLLVLAAGLALRLLCLGDYPLSVNQDELSNIYDGYAIAQTGADRWGQPHPLILRGFGPGDYRPPLYAWLSAGAIRAFGFSVAAGRLVSALLGCGSLLLLHRVARTIGGSVFAFFALLLAVLSPWHLMYSRIASEGAMLPPFFLIGACFLWQQAHARHYRPGYLAALGLFVGLGTNGYQSSKLIFFLFALLLLAYLWRHAETFWWPALAFGLGCLAGASPQLVAMLTMPGHFFARASETTAFSPSFGYVAELAKRLVGVLLPKFLFFKPLTYNNLSMGRLLAVECVPFYLGLLLLPRVVGRRQPLGAGHLYALLLIAALPGLLTSDDPHALRMSGLVVLLPLVTAAGIVGAARYVARPGRRAWLLAACAAALAANGLLLLRRYLASPALQGENMQHALVLLACKVGRYQAVYDTVYVENHGNQPYLYFAAYGGLTPRQFQQAPKVLTSGIWDNFQRLGKYRFLDSAASRAAARHLSPRSLLVLRTRSARPHLLLDSAGVGPERTYLYAGQ